MILAQKKINRPGSVESEKKVPRARNYRKHHQLKIYAKSIELF